MTELRQLVEADRPAHSKLMSEAFEGGRRPAPNMTGQPGEPEEVPVTWGILEGERLVATTTVHDLHLTWGDHDAPMGGVAGVACAADQRGRGHVDRLLKQSLIGMHEAGQYLSGLYPFAFAFYRRHGWEWVGERRDYVVPTAQLRSSPEGRHIQFYEGPDALDVVKPVYAAFARRYRGVTTREDSMPDWWKNALENGDNRTTYVHVHRDTVTGEADGYLTFRFGDDSIGHVGDFIANTPEAYRGLLSVLHYYGTQVEKVRFRAPADDALPLHVMHWDMETKIGPLFMGRVVDVKAALEALHPDTGLVGETVLQVHDERCEWNQGAWTVTVEDGQIAVKKTDRAPSVTLDIQALSQAYWGQPSLALLRNAGKVTAVDQNQFQLLSAVLPPTICYLQDGF